MAKIDNPLDQIDQQNPEPQDQGITMFANLAAPIIALLTASHPGAGAAACLSSFWLQFRHDTRSEARARAFQDGLREGFEECGARLDGIERRLSGPDFEDAAASALREVTLTARLDKARRFGRIIGTAMADDHANWQEAAEFIRNTEQLNDDDFRALEILVSVQNTAWRSVAKDGVRRMSLNPNDYTSSWASVIQTCQERGIDAEEWASRCLRLSGFGLAAPVQPNAAVNSISGAPPCRLTTRAVRLMQALGIFLDPRQYPRCKYHPVHGNRTVKNPDEERALGPGWFNTPNDFPKSK